MKKILFVLLVNLLFPSEENIGLPENHPNDEVIYHSYYTLSYGKVLSDMI